MNFKRISLLASTAFAALVLPLSLHADYPAWGTETVNGIEWTYFVADGKASAHR